MIARPEDLPCSCGGRHFVPVVSFQWSPKLGSSTRAEGYQCCNCHAVLDLGAMIEVAQKRAKRRELDALKAELGE